MKLTYRQLDESINSRQKLVNLINEKNIKKEKVTRKFLAEKMNRSTAWIDKARKQINTEEVCIITSEYGFSTKYTDLKQNGVYSKIIEMIEATEIKFPIFILSNKELCEIFNVKEKTVWMYRTFLNENLNLISQIWLKNKGLIDEMINEIEKFMKENYS